VLVERLKDLCKIADDNSTSVRSEALSKLFEMLNRKLGNNYLLTVQDHLKQLRLRGRTNGRRLAAMEVSSLSVRAAPEAEAFTKMGLKALLGLADDIDEALLRLLDRHVLVGEELGVQILELTLRIG
jgi:hypothetical protein